MKREAAVLFGAVRDALAMNAGPTNRELPL